MLANQQKIIMKDIKLSSLDNDFDIFDSTYRWALGIKPIDFCRFLQCNCRDFFLNLLIYQLFYVIIYSIRKDVVPMGYIQSVDIKGHYI